MKRGVKIIVLSVCVLILLVATGCSLGATEPDVLNESQPEAVPPVAAPVVEEISEPEVEDAAVENVTEDVAVEVPVSGSLDLQSDIGLCPHLAREFDCDRYDVRGCRFKQRIGDNGFFPDYMNCRSGEIGLGESHDSKFCFIQECSPIVVGNLAEKYGGTVAYVEYDYRLEKTGTGIMTYYDLSKCGEVYMEFDTKEDCRWYYSEWRKLWD